MRHSFLLRGFAQWPGFCHFSRPDEHVTYIVAAHNPIALSCFSLLHFLQAFHAQYLFCPKIKVRRRLEFNCLVYCRYMSDLVC